jgi:Ni,Fe-hydrogenase III small subunit
MDSAWRKAEAALPVGLHRAISIGQYPSEYELAGQWTAVHPYDSTFYGNGPTPAAALEALAVCLLEKA